MLIFTYGRDVLDPMTIPQQKYDPFVPFSKNCYYASKFEQESIEVIGFSPDDEFHSKLMRGIEERFKIAVVGLSNDDELEFWIRNQSISQAVAAIQFESTNVRPFLLFSLIDNNCIYFRER